MIRSLLEPPLPSADAPCCAHCGGIGLDPLAPPESPADMLARGSGCPISIVAYRVARELQAGRSVVVRDRPGRTPLLVIDGSEVDPLEDYSTQDCGCTV